ncbi:hypothetical protein U5922_008850 [Aquicoccus sp. G2-2]|jgi:hypothetical protein|uniref:hypothetical protein n=1 Tax=Aquicoccus sp. G2-2 TaxID=3092120 RepID=UPI002ADFB931|nr:hypothetical protein [Aquicoccus sp. G2-2]MEA1113579.1 hypothetical protein [Aquicoccus sp. G2-2]
MIGKSISSRLKLQHGTVTLSVAGLAFTIIYFLFLAYQNHRATAYMAELRESDTRAYLDQIRKLEGFSAYLAARSKLYGGDEYNSNVPPFLIGRWTMHTKPTRLGVGAAVDCTDPITFEYGMFRIEDEEMTRPAKFRMVGEMLEVKPLSTPVFDVRLISYGPAIDHLEFVPPGREETYYAYPCGF